MGNCAELLVSNFLSDGIGIAKIEAFEDFAVGILAVDDFELYFKSHPSAVFCRFHFRLVHDHIIPPCRDRVLLTCIRDDSTGVKIQLSHDKFPNFKNTGYCPSTRYTVLGILIPVKVSLY